MVKYKVFVFGSQDPVFGHRYQIRSYFIFIRNAVIDDILRHPFSGIGKPEPLKHQLKGYWSRRINDEHRLVYKITETEIIIISCKFHYD